VAGLDQAVARVDEVCAALARRGQWLRVGGEEGWPDGTVAGRYRFGHAHYQQVLYGRVAAARRVRLHQRIGARLEVGYGAEAGARAAELAMHFARAGLDSPQGLCGPGSGADLCPGADGEQLLWSPRFLR
jgi:hypothetical protein